MNVRVEDRWLGLYGVELGLGEANVSSAFVNYSNCPECCLAMWIWAAPVLLLSLLAWRSRRSLSFLRFRSLTSLRTSTVAPPAPLPPIAMRVLTHNVWCHYFATPVGSPPASIPSRLLAVPG